MTAPSKTSPVEALRQAYNELNEIRARDGIPYTSEGFESSVDREYFSKVVDDCKAAIPIAELEHEAVELLREIDVPCTCPTVAPLAPPCKHKRKKEIFDKLEALCNPPKT